MSVTVEQLKAKSLSKKNQNIDLLINVRAKAAELKSVIEDLQAFNKDLDNSERFLVAGWMDDTTTIYRQAGEIIKGA